MLKKNKKTERRPGCAPPAAGAAARLAVCPEKIAVADAAAGVPYPAGNQFALR